MRSKTSVLVKVALGAAIEKVAQETEPTVAPPPPVPPGNISKKTPGTGGPITAWRRKKNPFGGYMKKMEIAGRLHPGTPKKPGKGWVPAGKRPKIDFGATSSDPFGASSGRVKLESERARPVGGLGKIPIAKGPAVGEKKPAPGYTVKGWRPGGKLSPEFQKFLGGVGSGKSARYGFELPKGYKGTREQYQADLGKAVKKWQAGRAPEAMTFSEPETR